MQLIQLTLSEYKHIETFLESSAKKQQSIPDIFYYAVKAVVHPAEPLVEFHTAALKPLCVKALKRIFLLCDANQVSLAVQAVSSILLAPELAGQCLCFCATSQLDAT